MYGGGWDVGRYDVYFSQGIKKKIRQLKRAATTLKQVLFRDEQMVDNQIFVLVIEV